MTLAQRIGQLAREQEITHSVRNFLKPARCVAVEKIWLTGSQTDLHQCSGSKSIQRVLKSVVAPGSTTGWGQALTPYAQLADAFLLSLHSASASIPCTGPCPR